MANSAFSEPEIAVIRDLCESHEFKLALNYHCYGNLLLNPWVYIAAPCPDAELYYAFEELMTIDNNYECGPNTFLYECNGEADDWMYGEQTTKDKIISFSPELGSDDDGLWCAIDRIIPIAQENMIQNISIVLFAGNYAVIKETSLTIYEETSGYITFDITRLGLEDGGDFYVHLEPISDVILSVGDANYFSNMNILEAL